MASTMTARGGPSDEALRDRLVDEFRKRRGEATKADLVAATGLPLERVEAELPSVSDEYGARLRVTESGEILYSFPKGLRSRYRGLGPSLSRFWKSFRKGLVETGKLLFKGWIVFMLVGYFVLFILLAIVAFLASMALRRGEDDRGGGLGGIFVTGRLLETIINIWFYSELFKDPRQRAWEAEHRAQKRRERRPLHKAVFSFVFGEPDPNANWDEIERRAVVAWLQSHKGVISMPEFRALTGLRPLEAEERINLYLRDFKGNPEVSEGGSILFTFPDLLRRADKGDASLGGSAPMKRLAPFSMNTPKANRWFGIINVVNLAFGTYFLAGALAAHPLLPAIYGGRYATRLVWTGGLDGFYLFVHQLLGKMGGMADPSALLGIGLGVVPVAFGALFFAIPGLRSLRWRMGLERVKVDNLRRVAYSAVLARPEGLSSSAIEPPVDEARPSDPGAAEKILVELAAAEGGEPEALPSGKGVSWSWPSIARAREEAEKRREEIKGGDFALGKAVFDSHE